MAPSRGNTQLRRTARRVIAMPRLARHAAARRRARYPTAAPAIIDQHRRDCGLRAAAPRPARCRSPRRSPGCAFRPAAPTLRPTPFPARLAELQRHGNHRVAVDLQDDAGLRVGAEARERRFEAIRPERQVQSARTTPVSSVTTSRRKPVSVWIAVTVTPGSTPPLESTDGAVDLGGGLRQRIGGTQEKNQHDAGENARNTRYHSSLLATRARDVSLKPAVPRCEQVSGSELGC